ncbi:MAG TPA: copper resistance protein B [Gammaproteobacteria bacterium]|nr:copper resistance protein B [Gammaproteobacteria bacterium]
MSTITTMSRLRIMAGLCMLAFSLPAAAARHMEDDPLLFMLRADELEIHDADENPLSWDIEAWLGKDLNKFRLRTEGERSDQGTANAETQALYSRAVAPCWDLQFGLRRDSRPAPTRNWAVIGWRGLAPYWFDIDANLFLGENGRSALRLEAEYEILVTQRLTLSPDIEFNLYGKDDRESGIGSGLSVIETGLRLSYEIGPEFAPYIGFDWERSYGKTADFAKASGEESADNVWVAGLRFWF